MAAEVASEQCLVPYPGLGVPPKLEADCKSRSPVNCAMVLCALSELPSRVVTDDGDGGCRFGDECQRDEDCVLATDHRPCCPCPESTPVAVADAEPCVIRSGTGPPIPEECNQCEVDVRCEPCEEPKAPTCQLRNSFSLCQ